MCDEGAEGPDGADGERDAAGGLFAAVHHVGVTVGDLDRAVGFWHRLLGATPRNRRVLDGPMLGAMVGYPGVRIDSCWLDLPGGVALELLQYLDRDEPAHAPGTAHPGNVHVCLRVPDMEAAHRHAVACGARPVSERPVDVVAGPRAGARLAYLRDPDGVTIELVQDPR
ncbi:MAG TPA: VOC family protein [Acidimicrobiales bacterium]|nr:VOC family protein [Acidimicrobiales bacterium]